MYVPKSVLGRLQGDLTGYDRLNTSHTTKQYQSRISLKYIYQPPNQSCLTISIAFLWFRVRRNWEIDIIM